MFEDSNHKGWMYAAYGVMIAAAFLMYLRLGSYPMQMQWEPNYAQVLREMVWGEGDAITPASRVGNDEGAAYGWFWSKPILIFWLSYPLMAAFGSPDQVPNPWLFRIPNATIGLLGVFMMFFFMSRLYSRRAGVISAVVYATTSIYFVIARAYIVDILAINFWFFAMGFFLLGEKTGKAKYYYWFYFNLGVAMLAKGLLPLMLAGGIMFVYMLVTCDFGLPKRLRMHKGIPIFLAVGFAWYMYMLMRFGKEYGKIFFWNHHFGRSLGTIDKPNDTFHMFVLNFAVGIMPWVTFLPAAFATALPWRSLKADKRSVELFFVIGLAFSFTFFCMIDTKFPHYIFPTAPFAALLIGRYLDRWYEAGEANHANAVIIFGIFVFGIVAPDVLDQKNYRIIWYFMNTERLQDWHASVGDPKQFFVFVYALWIIALFAAMLFKSKSKWLTPALVASVAFYGVFALFLHPNDFKFDANGMAAIRQNWNNLTSDGIKIFGIIYFVVVFGIVVFAAFKKQMHRFALPILGLLAFSYAFYITTVMVPSLNWMFNARSLFEQYYSLRKSPDEPIGEFTRTWKSRSIKFEMTFNELEDKYKYHDFFISDSLNSVKNWYERFVKREDGSSRRAFIIIEQKQLHFTQIQNLWRRATGGEVLVKIGDDGDPNNERNYKGYVPEFWLVSNYDNNGRLNKTTEEEVKKSLSQFVKKSASECSSLIAVPHETALGADKNIKLLGYELLAKRTEKDQPRKLEIKNWEIDKPELRSGERLVIRTFWTLNNKISKDFEIFIHVERPQGFRHRGDHAPVNNEFPTTEWEPGSCVIDEFEVEIPADTTTGDAAVFIGLFKGDSREPSEPKPWREPDNRIKLGTIKVIGKY